MPRMALKGTQPAHGHTAISRPLEMYQTILILHIFISSMAVTLNIFLFSHAYCSPI